MQPFKISKVEVKHRVHHADFDMHACCNFWILLVSHIVVPNSLLRNQRTRPLFLQDVAARIGVFRIRTLFFTEFDTMTMLDWPRHMPADVSLHEI